MPISGDERGSPGWFLQRLGEQLYAGQDRVQLLDDYYTGNAPLPGSAPTARQAYWLFRRLSRWNPAEVIVDSRADRMIPNGFRTGADGDESGDAEARRLWDSCDLDVTSVDVHQAMLAHGKSFVIVGKDDATEQLFATAEDARQVTTLQDPMNPARTRAGLKVFRDEPAGEDLAYLYLPGRVLVASKPVDVKGSLVLAGGFALQGWEWDDSRSFDLDPGLGDVVGVVRFLNARGGRGEFEGHTDTLDRINVKILQEVVALIMQAFRQRAVKGDLPKHDERGEVIDYDQVFAAGPDALWLLPETAEMWESAALDLGPMLNAVKDDVLRLAAGTKTPMHMFNPDSAVGSAEGASLQREGIVFTVKDRIKRATLGWRQVMSLLFRFAGDEQRADLSALSPIWAPPEQWSLAERADAASKAQDVPWRSRMIHIWGFDPATVDRMESERAADAFLAQALAAAQPQPGQQAERPEPEPVTGGAAR